MKKVAFILILIAIGTLLAKAQLALNNAPFAALLKRSAGVQGYFFQENFEAPGYENTWTQAGTGTINDQSTTAPAPLQGSYSLRITLTTDNGRTTNVFGISSATRRGELYGFMLINYFDLPTAGGVAKNFLTHEDSSGNPIFSLAILPNGGGLHFPIIRDAGGDYSAGSTTILPNTTYYVWWHYVKGTGANAQYELTWSTTGTKGATIVSTSSGVATAELATTLIGATNNSGWGCVFDKIRLSTTDIGSNPP